MEADLAQLTINQAKAGLGNKIFNCQELVKSVLSRIEKYNSKLNIYLTIEGKAIESAKRIDSLIRRNSKIHDAFPLAGIPIAVKDNFSTLGLETTASSKVLAGYLPQYESTVTKRLKKAGAIIIGKTNMDAWAHGSSTETSDFGPTKNPWDQTRLPGGSSGGSAAAIAADLCIASIGSETAGSIRQPASWCGVTGLKPSYGRVSRYGVIAMASSTDSPGPITKDARDSALILQIIAGEDEADATSMKGKWKAEIVNCKKRPEYKIGIVREYFLSEAEKGVNEKVMEAVSLLKKNGIKIQKINLLDPKYAIADYMIIQRSEVSSNLARYDGIRYGHERKFFGKEAKRRIMLGTHTLSSGYYDRYYQKAQKVRTKIINDLSRAFKEVDILISPTSPSTALPLGSSLDQAMFGEMQDILVEAYSLAGLPGISIPCGFVNGLPVGLQMVAKMGEEEKILQLASYYQELTNYHLLKPKIT